MFTVYRPGIDIVGLVEWSRGREVCRRQTVLSWHSTSPNIPTPHLPSHTLQTIGYLYTRCLKNATRFLRHSVHYNSGLD